MKELQKVSVVRDDHIHKLIWTSVIGKEFSLECKELNAHDEYAVVVRNTDHSLICFESTSNFLAVVAALPFLTVN